MKILLLTSSNVLKQADQVIHDAMGHIMSMDADKMAIKVDQVPGVFTRSFKASAPAMILSDSIHERPNKGKPAFTTNCSNDIFPKYFNIRPLKSLFSYYLEIQL